MEKKITVIKGDPIDQFQMTMNSLKETGAEVGNSLMTVLTPVLKQISEKLKSLAEWWNNLGEPIPETAAGEYCQSGCHD